MHTHETHWLTEYLDNFDIHCENTDCAKCPLKKLHDQSPDKSCFRIYCELHDSGQLKEF